MAMVISFRVVLGWPGRYRPWRHPGGNPRRGPGEPASSEEDEDRNLHPVLDPPDREGRRYALNRPTGMRSSRVASTALTSEPRRIDIAAGLPPSRSGACCLAAR